MGGYGVEEPGQVKVAYSSPRFSPGRPSSTARARRIPNDIPFGSAEAVRLGMDPNPAICNLFKLISFNYMNQDTESIPRIALPNQRLFPAES